MCTHIQSLQIFPATSNKHFDFSVTALLIEIYVVPVIVKKDLRITCTGVKHGPNRV